MDVTNKKSTIRDRVIAVLQNKRPDRIPFIDRMYHWYKSKLLDGTLPERLKGMSLAEVHQEVGLGQQTFSPLYAFKLRNVEVIYTFENETFHQEFEPAMELFPAGETPEHIPKDKCGQTDLEFITPVGKLNQKFEYTKSMHPLTGIEPYLKEHLIKTKDDYRTAEYIVEHAEFVPLFERIDEEEKNIGCNGYVVPCLSRIPFQQILLEYLGEIPLFYALHECPDLVERLLKVLDLKLIEVLKKLSDFKALYVEFPDNLDGVMTNPNLFKKYCLPYYQNYCEILHLQGKKVGCHADGNLKPLLDLLTYSCLDVVESFTPAPLTECGFEEAWKAWNNGPLIWGGIPSIILENRTPEFEFKNYVKHLLETVGANEIILGIGDMVMADNIIERVEYIAEKVEKHRT